MSPVIWEQMKVTVYDVIGEGKLNIATIYRAEKGMGARHITFHPNGKIAYLVGELNSTIEVLSYNEEKRDALPRLQNNWHPT